MPAIYQRARPARFDEVVGQDHVTGLLVAALRRDAIGHAYLFSGPRGVGKTTSARLLAMAVNCDAAADERPCGRCTACLAVQSGGHPDVIELDAASNNSVDDVRELREQVRLAPLRGGRRVWILDEAHMLSRAAANALLKTLEEPPPGLLFILATTEPEKLPATVLSRCQHFRFRRLSDDEIRGKLQRLVLEADRSAEDDALALLARAADGAMRDAESMLERLLASGEPITRDGVEGALGLPPFDRMAHLVGALADGDLGPVLSSAAELYADGFAPRTLAEQVGRTLRDVLVARVRGRGPEPSLDLDIDEDAIVRALHVVDDAHERFVRRGDLYALEVTLIRVAAAMRPPAPAPPAVLAATAPEAERAPAPSAVPAPQPRSRPDVVTPGGAPPAAKGGFDPNARPARQERTSAGSERPAPVSWHALLARAGPQLKAFLLPAEATLEGDRLDVRYDERHAFHFGQLQRREAAFLELVDAVGGAHLHVLVVGPGGRMQRAAGAARDAAAVTAPTSVPAHDSVPVLVPEPEPGSVPGPEPASARASGPEHEEPSSEEPPKKV
ncbi:MAG: DNA polymerase III subunit gamma/tau [Trueperaceae bacterium]|nr:MAG: DNA polymerase III subunit gamma/tau [Trueperaceae bacterium]